MSIVALAGGVGAAKFLRGLVEVMPPEDLTIISNTGDDIEMFGLHISPDIDIVAYTLSGLVDDERGWGIRGDTFDSLDMIRRYGEDVWFNLGDRDLATHILRTRQLHAGLSLTAITTAQCAALGIPSRILPMCDQPVPSMIRTPSGYFHFQEYLVQRGGGEDVLEVVYQDIAHASPAPGIVEALAGAEAILFCPSNPIISVGTILAVPGIREAIRNSPAPVVAVSPIVQGATLKGPADLMLRGLGFEVSAYGVAQYYGDLLSGFIVDTLDADLGPKVEALGLRVDVTQSIMTTLDDKVALAKAALTLARALFVTYAVIPVKNFEGAKQRLSAFLQPHERAQLARAMFTDTLTACRQAQGLDGMGVVTSHEGPAEIATSLGVEVWWEPEAGGHSQAVAFGVQTCLQRGIDTMLTIPGDIPLVTPADVEAMVRAATPAVPVVLAPNRDDLGTNAMRLSPPDCLPLQFGHDSFQRHLNLAAERQLAVEIRRLPRLALDIDEPEDLALFAAHRKAGHSLDVLIELGLLERLASIPIPPLDE